MRPNSTMPMPAPRQNGTLTDSTIHDIREALSKAREEHPDGATLAALLKHAGRLAAVLIAEGRAEGGCKSCASTPARRAAIGVAVVVVRLIEGA